MSSPASNIRSSSSALADFFPLISLNLIIPGAAYGDDPDRLAADGEKGRPEAIFDHPDNPGPKLRLASRVDVGRVVIQPKRLRRLEIDPVLGEIRRALLRIELEDHARPLHTTSRIWKPHVTGSEQRSTAANAWKYKDSI